MTEPSTTPTWQVIALVGRVGAREILVQDGVGTATLPTAERPTEIELYAADAVAVVEAMLMTPVVPLRLTWLPAEDWRSGSIVVELEPLDAAPGGFRWIDPTDVLDSVEPQRFGRSCVGGSNAATASSPRSSRRGPGPGGSPGRPRGWSSGWRTQVSRRLRLPGSSTRARSGRSFGLAPTGRRCS